jgi:DNA-binding CsgD family transcriptional regulator
VAGDFGEALSILRDHAGVDATTGEAVSSAPPGGTASTAPLAKDDLHELTDAEPRSDGPSARRRDRLPSQRDRLLLAAMEASIARRSGDTTRLRSAWRRAEEALIRPSASWLLVDPMAELLAAGARIGDGRRVEPIVEAVAAQGLGLPDSGPGPASAHWLRLQVAIASEDRELVTASAEAMAELETTDPRSRARASAAAIWSAIAGVDEARSPVSEDDVVAVAELLSDVGDRWEASRILGQAALDETDPKAARRLLELARVAATDQVDDAAGDGLAALGLSEREAEVALLVVEGRTHKEVGAQLFISPKTVEHHVAKIRQKVGASSRAELLSIIREAVGGA